MRGTRRIIALILTMMMLLCSSTVVMADNVENESLAVTRYNDEYGFTYTEQIDENGNTIRTYMKEDRDELKSILRLTSRSVEEDSSDVDFAEMKAILSDLGMGEDFVEELSDEQLARYAQSESITSAVSYVTNVGEDLDQPVIDGGGSNGDYEAMYPAYGGDASIELTLIVYEYSDGMYGYSIDAEWLTIPSHLYTDSIGAASQNITVYPATISGWYKYMGGNGTLAVKKNITGDILYNNGWGGAGASFTFPKPITAFQVHLEFEAIVDNLSDITTRNAVATYCHMKKTLDVSDSLTINSSGEVVYAITITTAVDYVNYKAVLDDVLVYYP